MAVPFIVHRDYDLRQLNRDGVNYSDFVDGLGGRKLSVTPQHLTRALYIPHHTNKTTHIPVYDITTQYNASIGDASIGTSRYKVRLCLMQKPTTSSIDVDVRYLYYIDTVSGTATIDERSLGWNGQQVQMCLPSSADENVSINIAAPQGRPKHQISESYPLPPKSIKGKTIRFPYFSISSAAETSATTLEWQVHPVDHGVMQYTLVDITDDNEESAIRAVYHHAGLEADLPYHYSEGVLLLPENSPGSEEDALTVSSLLGILFMIRRNHRDRKKSLFGGILGSKRG